MKSLITKAIAAMFLFISFYSCGKDEVEVTCNYDACAAKAPSAEVQNVKDYLAANNITATEHCSGLFYRIENAGTGKTPQACSNISVRYIGRLTNGNVFDQSTNPVTFNLQGVIRGWTNSLPLIKEGGKIILYLPPSLAYGSQEIRNPNTGALVIPANSILIFEVELVAVQ